MDIDLESCISGDKASWDAFVDRYAPVIWAAVRRVVRGRLDRGDGREVEDAVQDVFVRLVRHDYRLLRSYDPNRAAITTWLTVVARSVAIDMMRRKRLETVAIDPHDVPERQPTASKGPAIPLHLLSGRQRLVLRLLFDEDRSVADAARVLGVDEQTIRSTKHKALTRLRNHFESQEPTPDESAGMPPTSPP